MKKIVLVGHCGPDSSYLRLAVQSAEKGAAIMMADDDATLRAQLDQGVDLVLMNRTLDYGFPTESGVELISQLRATSPGVRFMLVSNHPEAQTEAIAAGAFPGFGKRELGTGRVAQVIGAALHESPIDR